MTTCYYRIKDNSNDDQRFGYTARGAYKAESVEDLDDTLAEWCAEDYWDNHDGWEDRWPKTIVLYLTEDGPECVEFEVEVEAVPQFSASEVES